MVMSINVRLDVFFHIISITVLLEDQGLPEENIC